MRKVVLLIGTSLDGYVQRPNSWDIEWILYIEQSIEYADEFVSTVGSPDYGRVTYEGMRDYWPTVFDSPASSEHDVKHPNWLENVTKIVISNSMEKTDWNNSILIKDNVVEGITKLKQMPGKDLVIFCSPTLAHYFMQHDLIDEFRISVVPVVLGEGIPLFKDIKDRIKLNLLDSRQFRSGVVALHYQLIRG
jgi:dihydrofolate reductase